MRAAVCDGSVTYVTDPEGTKTVKTADFGPIQEGDVVAGGSLANRKFAEIIGALRPDSGYANVIIGEDSMYFTDNPAFLIKLSRPAGAMWRCTFDDVSMRAIDDSVRALMKYSGDEIWDSKPKDSEYLASDYLSNIRMIRDTIKRNITDTTMRLVVCGRICMYGSFRDSMPDYAECIEPAQLSKEIYEKFSKITKGRDKI